MSLCKITSNFGVGCDFQKKIKIKGNEKFQNLNCASSNFKMEQIFCIKVIRSENKIAFHYPKSVVHLKKRKKKKHTHNYVAHIYVTEKLLKNQLSFIAVSFFFHFILSVFYQTFSLRSISPLTNNFFPISRYFTCHISPTIVIFSTTEESICRE